MAKFTTEQTQVSGVPTVPLRSGISRTARGDTTSASADRSATTKEIIEGAFDVTSAVAKGLFAEDIKELDEKTQGFTKLRQQLIEDARSASDRKEFDKTVSKLQTLERGEMAGVITPAESRARKQTLLKQNVSNFPWLAPEFKSLASVFAVGGATGLGTGGLSPEEKGLNDIREESARTGFSPSFVRETFRAQVNNQLLVANRDNALARGTLNFPTIRESWTATVDTIRSKTLGELFAMEKQDPKSIDETDWTTWLSNMEEDYKSALIGEQSSLSKKGIILTPEQRETMEKDLEGGMAVARQFVKSKDKLAYLKRHRGFLEEQGFVTISKQNPYYGFLVSNGMQEQAAEFAFKTWPKFQAMVAKDGNIDKIRLLAEEGGDTNAIVFLNALQFNKEMLSQSMHNKLLSGGTGTSKTEDVVINGMAGSWLSTPNVEGDKVLNDTHQAAMNKLTNPDAPIEELKWFLKGSVVPQVATNEKWRGQLDNRTDLETAAILTEILLIPTSKRRGWSFDLDTNNELVIKNPKGESLTHERVVSRGARGMLKFPEMPVEFRQAIKDLKLINQVKTKYGLYSETKKGWLDFVVNKLNTSLTIEEKEKKEKEEPRVERRNTGRGLK